MSLMDAIKKRAKDFGLLAVLAASSVAAVSQTGCGYQRMGDTGVSYWLSPTVVTIEKYADETSNVVVEKEETSVSVFFGNIDTVVKKWERGKYLGKIKTMVREALNPEKMRMITEEYDEKDRLIRELKE